MNALSVWDVTAKGETNTKEHIMDVLIEVADRWVFQREEGKNEENKESKEEKKGYNHFQIRLSLKKKIRQPGFIELLRARGINDFHVSPTSNKGQKANGSLFSYVMKEDTRVDGPWKDDKTEKAEAIPADILETEKKGLYPWQQAILDNIKEHKRNLSEHKCEGRIINVLIDITGNNGKSWFKKYLMWYKHAQCVANLSKPEDLLAAACGMENYDAWICDIPRAYDTKVMGGLFAGLESLKNGMVEDKRHTFKRKMFSPPCIWVMMNQAPDLTWLSNDRWCCWMIDNEKRLVQWTAKRQDKMLKWWEDNKPIKKAKVGEATDKSALDD